MFNFIKNKIQPCNGDGTGEIHSPPNTSVKCSVCLEEGREILTTCRGGDHCNLCCECTFALVTERNMEKCPVCRQSYIDAQEWMVYDTDVLRRDQNVSNVVIVHNYTITNINMGSIEETDIRSEERDIRSEERDLELGYEKCACRVPCKNVNWDKIIKYAHKLKIALCLTFMAYLIGLFFELFLFPNPEMATLKPHKIMINILTGAGAMTLVKCCCNCRDE